jgi:hypothetical protein
MLADVIRHGASSMFALRQGEASAHKNDESAKGT